MAEKFNMADFLHKNSWFFGSGTAEWNVLIFGYVMLPVLFYLKKLLPVVTTQNGDYIQDGVEIAYIFHQIISKMIICPFFLWFFQYFGLKIKLMQHNFFLKGSQWCNGLRHAFNISPLRSQVQSPVLALIFI
jgi:hypothetical protein